MLGNVESCGGGSPEKKTGETDLEPGQDPHDMLMEDGPLWNGPHHRLRMIQIG